MRIPPPPRLGDPRVRAASHNRVMTTLAALSNDLADLAAKNRSSIVQVLGARRPASGVIHGEDTIVTVARALGREDGLRVRIDDADPIDADLAGWDPATGLAVLRTRDKLKIAVPTLAQAEPRVGQIVLALGRSWSHSLTVSAGVVAIVGGPLRTGRHREIPRVIRVTAPMHEGFAGGGVFDADGQLTGIATAAVIRGFAVTIPAAFAWTTATHVLTTGGSRGFVGVAVQPVDLPTAARTDGRERGLLVVGVTSGGPADTAGIIVGDLLLDFDGVPVQSAEELLDRLTGEQVGKRVHVRTLHGGAPSEVEVLVANRPRG
jgi:S1-C subfamily serine protease